MNPIWLWGLAGLLIPVGIHLLSRKDMRVIRIGSLRHLEDATTRQTVRIQPHAYLLLAVRSLIVVAVTLLLAGLYFDDRHPATRWVLIEPGLTDKPVWRPVIDSLMADGYAAKLFQAGFPELNNEEHPRSVPDYWALTEALNSMQLDRCVIISRGQILGYAGSRPGQNARITWLTDVADSARFVLTTERTAGDSIIARVGHSNASATSFETLRLPAAEEQTMLSSWTDDEETRSGSSHAMASETDEVDEVLSPTGDRQRSSKDATTDLMRPLKVVLSGTNVSDEERHVMRAVLQAIDDYSIVRIQVTEGDPTRNSDGDWLIWLSTDVPPSTKIRRVIRKASSAEYPGMPDDSAIGSGILVAARADDAAHVGDSLRDGPSARTPESPIQYWSITQPLTPSSTIRNQLTLRLATLLLGDANKTLGHWARRHDRRVMPESEMLSPKSISDAAANTHPVEKNKNGAGILAAGLLALMALERWMANRQQL